MNASLIERMERLLVRESDLVEKFVHGSGPGGQKINKTASCVYLRHIPTGIEVHCQDGRARERNREMARERLCDQIEVRRQRDFLERARRRAKARFARRKPSAATKAKVRQSKTHRSDKKKNRRKLVPGKHEE